MQDSEDIPRRAVLRTGTLLLAGGALSALPACHAGRRASGTDQPLKRPAARIGFLADVHYADKATANTRHYRDSLPKMQAAVETLNRSDVDAVVELGDFIDSADDIDTELAHLDTIESLYSRLDVPRHYVLGNHCVHRLTKDEFMRRCGMDACHTSFDIGGVRMITLDACFNAAGEPYQRENFHWTDANIPAEQLQWLERQLASAPGPVVVFTHQRIDGLDVAHNVRNGERVRRLLDAAGNVLLVLSGHSHHNLHANVNGIDYVVARAMVEEATLANNAFGVLTIEHDHSMRIDGFARQEVYAPAALGAVAR